MVGAITASSTQSFDLTATETGDHELRFTFFDGSGDGTSTTGSFDEIYVYQKSGNLLVWETFTLNEGEFKLRNVISDVDASEQRLFVSESKLNFYAKQGGGDAHYSVELQKDISYQITASITPNAGAESENNFPTASFTLYDTDGLKLRTGIDGLQS